jgi:hypothetical protein
MTTYFDRKDEMGLLSERLRAVLEQLEEAASDYQLAKSETDRPLVRFDMALERFKVAKQRASQMMSSLDLYAWGMEHPQIRYTGSAIGDAIIHVLQSHAYDQAGMVARNETKTFSPFLNLESITEKLDLGGYEFRTPTPAREVNAALINLEGVVKTDTVGGKIYAIEGTDGLVEQIRDSLQRIRREQQGG